MGLNASHHKSPITPIPQYVPPYNIPRPIPPYNPGMGNVSLDKRKQKKLLEAYKTIQTLQNQMPPTARPVGSSLGSYGSPPIMNVSQVSPRLQRTYGQQTNTPGYPPASIGYRDTDFSAVANIAGLNPADVALLYREYTNLTRGGRNKIDRVVFRQILRDVLVEANNENIDRSLENIFVSIDRNHDGFIDFPEFVGAFRDVLKGEYTDPGNYSPQMGLSDLINQQVRTNVNNPTLLCQPLPMIQQAQPATQIITIPSSSFEQSSNIYNGSVPIVLSADSNQSSYIPNIQGQSIIQQPGGLQYLPLSI